VGKGKPLPGGCGDAGRARTAGTIKNGRVKNSGKDRTEEDFTG